MDEPVICMICEFGAQASRSVSKMNPIYRWDRRDCAPLSGLTELNSDHPGTRNLRFRHVLGEMPELIFARFWRRSGLELLHLGFYWSGMQY